MIAIAKLSLLFMLFMLFYAMIRPVILVAFNRTHARLRLHYVQQGRWSRRFVRWLSRYRPIYLHLYDLLDSIGNPIRLSSFALLSFFLALAGVMAGALYFGSVKGTAICGVMMAGMPYIGLRMRLFNQHLKSRLDFLPAAEVFYQCYLLAGQQNVRHALQLAITENRIRHPLKPVFERLHRQLSTHHETDACFRVFSLSIGHVWAEYFANLLRVSFVEGAEITAPLRELIADMRRAQRTDQADRNRLLEIRLANFTPLGFLLLFLAINFRINFHNAYSFYVINEAGRNMMLDALLLIFASFLMGLYLSMRRM